MHVQKLLLVDLILQPVVNAIDLGLERFDLMNYSVPNKPILNVPNHDSTALHVGKIISQLEYFDLHNDQVHAIVLITY